MGSGDPRHVSLDLGRPSLQVHERFRLRPEAGGGWEAVAVALTRKLQALAQLGLTWVRVERDERQGWPYFAQFAPDEGGALFSEVVGNFYIGEPDARLGPSQLAQLRDLGWGDPVEDPSTDDNIQPRNHTRTWPVPIDFGSAASLVVVTLAAVYGIAEEEELLVSVDPW